jgi:hypothetical protein
MAPENLQFFLWYKDYEKRFNDTPNSETTLAPEWSEAHAEDERRNYREKLKQPSSTKGDVKEVFKGTDFEDKPKTVDPSNADATPFDNPSNVTSMDDRRGTVTSEDGTYAPTVGMSSLASNHTHTTAEAFEEAGMSQPFTVQPFREEISRIISVYVNQGSPRQLNLSGRERHQLLKALEYTTHPTAFREVINTVEYSLRRQAHPNFIRWAICNGNRPRVIFARGLGVFLIIAALVTLILITLSRVGRGWRVLPIILLILGISTLIAAWKGMCVVLHGLHHQHVRPWELFVDDSSEIEGKHSGEFDPKTSMSAESIRSVSANSFESEPWVTKYPKRNFIRKIFDRERWIEEPALRQIQDTIFLQALLGAFVISAIIVAIFVAVPSPRML